MPISRRSRLQDVKSRTKKQGRTHTSSVRAKSAVKREVEQLRDWADRSVELEFIVQIAGGSIIHIGRVPEMPAKDWGSDFVFESDTGLRALLIPRFFPKSQLEKDGPLGPGLCVEGKTRGEMGFAIREHRIEQKPHPKLGSVLEKLRTWARLQLDVNVLLSHGHDAMSLLAQVHEVSSGVFSFGKAPTPFQLIIRAAEYAYMSVVSEGEKSSIILIDPHAQEVCVVSDAATRPETVFEKFVARSTVH